MNDDKEEKTMSSPTNTERDDRHPEWTMGGNPEGIIEQERRGQRELIESDVIPTKMLDLTEEGLVGAGFQLGPEVEGDPLFRYATLPDGWSIEKTDHQMWSDIVDENGKAVFKIFYKAAFYDRKAHLVPAS